MRCFRVHHPLLLAGAVVVPYALFAPHVAAEDTGVPPSASLDDSYDTDVDTALLEYERGNFEESREYFRRAHALRPSARTLRGLGKVEFELRNYAEARKFLDASRKSEVNPLDDGLREEVERLLARTNAYLGQLSLEVEPSTATIHVDGGLVGTGPRATLVLMVGDHVLDVRDAARLADHRTLRIHGGEVGALRVVLAPASARPDAAAPVRDGLGRGAWLGITIGVVVGVAAAVGVGVALARRNSNDEHALSGGNTGLVLVNR